MQDILHRIFKDKQFPPNATKDEMHKFFDESVKDFENGPFLKDTALPVVESETGFQEKLFEHRDEVLLVKFWKRNCIPCLSVAEMYKKAEKRCSDEKLPVRFYSINTKEDPNRSVTDYQLIEGTPTLQRFHNFAQIGDDIQATTFDDLMSAIYDSINSVQKTKHPNRSAS